MVSGMDVAELRAAFTAASARQIGLAILLTAVSYSLLTCYDALALRQLKLKVPYRTTALASFTSYAVSFTLGFPLLTAGTVRYWIYAPRGLSPGKVASLTVIAGVTFWLGMALVLGLEPDRRGGRGRGPRSTRISGSTSSSGSPRRSSSSAISPGSR